MVRIKISDLSADDEGKQISELTAWEIKRVYAGMPRRFGTDYLSDSPKETPTEKPSENSGFSLNGMSGSISGLMDNLEVQLRDIRSRLGI
ncbi:hypothetical protein [Nostoc sp. MS1]|uniref:hypothetical protein n=1 Tax=Nostoc sp. MS1 TaxID=2764711 RepID=UPI001CC50A79|nr:hypothetical protein [Nostoc sp. MS1]BCL38794.1 hypothetical protein NSMS1_52410 [Nostoc sp. MS1]